MVGFDEDKDIAVIRLRADARHMALLRPVILGDSSNLRVGQRVFALGNPFGKLHGMLTRPPAFGQAKMVTLTIFAFRSGSASVALLSAHNEDPLCGYPGLDHSMTSGIIAGLGREIDSGNTGAPIR